MFDKMPIESYDETKETGVATVEDKVKISVVIPVFQEEKILEKHLNLFNKMLRNKYNFELIVSDGGSSDKTVEIAEKYADKIAVHTDSRRQTIAEGRNRGAELSEGSVLVFINADTIPADIDKFFQTIIKWSNLKKYSAMACYVSGFPEEIIFKDKMFYTLHNFYVKCLNLIGIGMGRGECQVVRKEDFFQVGGYKDYIVAGEDFDLYRRINKSGKIKFERDLMVYESPRRFRKYGYIRTIFFWILNSITVMFFNRSASKEWEAVR